MKNLTPPFDEFIIGCNYFSSHRGIFMWRDWDEKVVDGDFRVLKSNHIGTIRIFPIWSDFQILTPHVRGARIEQMRRFETEHNIDLANYVDLGPPSAGTSRSSGPMS